MELSVFIFFTNSKCYPTLVKPRLASINAVVLKNSKTTNAENESCVIWIKSVST